MPRVTFAFPSRLEAHIIGLAGGGRFRDHLAPLILLALGPCLPLGPDNFNRTAFRSF